MLKSTHTGSEKICFQVSLRQSKPLLQPIFTKDLIELDLSIRLFLTFHMNLLGMVVHAFDASPIKASQGYRNSETLSQKIKLHMNLIVTTR